MTALLTASLRGSQNRDGGWSYVRGSSWTEPTAMALVALACHHISDDSVSRGIEFLLRTQRDDGGWAPKPGVSESTWVTSLTLLVPGIPQEVENKALGWLVRQRDRQSWLTERIRNFLSGAKPESGPAITGWSFYPGTAGWITPTAVAMLALRRCLKQNPRPEYDERLREGRKFLIARRCPDAGWNHGSSRALGYDLTSYPETTGQALLALRGLDWPAQSQTFGCAEQHLAKAASVEASAWLQLGLLAQGRQPKQELPSSPRSTTDAALALMLIAARTGVDPFEL